MQIIIQVLLVTTLMAGTFCQKLVFDKSMFISNCTSGAISGIDKFLITGTIGGNITMLLKQNWQTAVYINKLDRTSSQFNPICQLSIQGSKCTAAASIECDCFYNTTTDQAHFTVSDTVFTDDQGGVINAVWQHGNGTNIYSDKNYTFQNIYDMNAAHLELTVDGMPANLPSRSCSFNLTLNKTNNLKLCCSNTVKPCYPQISFSGVVKNASMCVRYEASQLVSDGVTENLALSYFVCNHTNTIQGSNCTVRTTQKETTTQATSSSSITTDVTTTTTESPSSSSNAADASTPTTEPSSSSSHTTDASTTTTELSSSSPHTTVPPKPDPVCNTTCIAVIVSVVVVIIIIGVAVAIYCWKTKKRPKGVSNQGTNGNGDQAHTGEHHKKDGHNAEHRNQAYDGRRSSPSEVTIDDVKTTKYENTQQRNTAHEKDSNKPISDRTNDDNASQSVPGNPRQLPPLKETHTHGQLHPPAGSRPVSVETTSATAVKL